MAPKGVKRGRDSSPVRPARKKTNADPVAPKCRDVVGAISKADALPDSCKEMLTNMVGSSLTIFASDRHSYQAQAVEMLSQTLAGVQAQMSGAVAQAQAKVDSSDREKAARAAALATAQASLTNQEQKTDAAKAATDDAKAGLATAKANAASAQSSIESKDAEVKAMTEQKAKLETALKDAWEPSKTGKAGKREVNALEKVFTEVGLEAGLVDSLFGTMHKDPEARGTFDGLVMKHVDTQSAAFMAKTDALLQAAESSKAALDNAKTTADGALASANEKVTESSATLQEVQASLKESHANLKVAQSGVTGFEKEMVNAGSSLEDAKAALASFTEGPMQSFAALKDLATPPEPVPEPVVEAPATEAATV